MKPDSLPLRRRLHLVYLLLATVLVLVSVAGALAYTSAAAAVTEQNVTLSPARAKALRLVVSLLDQETGLRGYALSGRAEFLAPYQNGVAEAEANDRELRTMLAGHVQAVADLNALEGAVNTWRADFVQPILARIKQTGASEVDAALLDRGKTDFDRIRAAGETLDTHLATMLSRSHQHIEDLLRLLALSFALSVAGVVLIGVGIWRALARWVVGPLDELGAEVRGVVGGQLDYQVRGGGPPEVRALAADVESMRQRIVAELRLAQSRRDTIEAQAARLADQAAELTRSNAELEQFAYVASHDLQEPLRKVAGFCQLLERRYAGTLDERADQYIAFAVDGATRMQRLINDLLAFSRVGRLGTRHIPVDLDVALAQALDSLGAAIEDTEAEVLAEPLPTVLGDPSLLRQVFVNLIANSLKFRGATPPRVRITAGQEGQEWVFRCVDNGIGIEAAYAERIFVIFQRLHGQDAYEGTGIGLAMCKKIVEFHGGRIWLDTTHTAGTAIGWTLPVANAEDAGDEASDHRPPNRVSTNADNDDRSTS